MASSMQPPLPPAPYVQGLSHSRTVVPVLSTAPPVVVQPHDTQEEYLKAQLSSQPRHRNLTSRGGDSDAGGGGSVTGSDRQLAIPFGRRAGAPTAKYPAGAGLPPAANTSQWAFMNEAGLFADAAFLQNPDNNNKNPQPNAVLPTSLQQLSTTTTAVATHEDLADALLQKILSGNESTTTLSGPQLEDGAVRSVSHSRIVAASRNSPQAQLTSSAAPVHKSVTPGGIRAPQCAASASLQTSHRVANRHVSHAGRESVPVTQMLREQPPQRHPVYPPPPSGAAGTPGSSQAMMMAVHLTSTSSDSKLPIHADMSESEMRQQLVQHLLPRPLPHFLHQEGGGGEANKKQATTASTMSPATHGLSGEVVPSSPRHLYPSTNASQPLSHASPAGRLSVVKPTGPDPFAAAPRNGRNSSLIPSNAHAMMVVQTHDVPQVFEASSAVTHALALQEQQRQPGGRDDNSSLHNAASFLDMDSVSTSSATQHKAKEHSVATTVEVPSNATTVAGGGSRRSVRIRCDVHADPSAPKPLLPLGTATTSGGTPGRAVPVPPAALRNHNNNNSAGGGVPTSAGGGADAEVAGYTARRRNPPVESNVLAPVAAGGGSSKPTSRGSIISTQGGGGAGAAAATTTSPNPLPLSFRDRGELSGSSSFHRSGRGSGAGGGGGGISARRLSLDQQLQKVLSVPSMYRYEAGTQQADKAFVELEAQLKEVQERVQKMYAVQSTRGFPSRQRTHSQDGGTSRGGGSAVNPLVLVTTMHSAFGGAAAPTTGSDSGPLSLVPPHHQQQQPRFTPNVGAANSVSIVSHPHPHHQHHHNSTSSAGGGSSMMLHRSASVVRPTNRPVVSPTLLKMLSGMTDVCADTFLKDVPRQSEDDVAPSEEDLIERVTLQKQFLLYHPLDDITVASNVPHSLANAVTRTRTGVSTVLQHDLTALGVPIPTAHGAGGGGGGAGGAAGGGVSGVPGGVSGPTMTYRDLDRVEYREWHRVPGYVDPTRFVGTTDFVQRSILLNKLRADQRAGELHFGLTPTYSRIPPPLIRDEEMVEGYSGSGGGAGGGERGGDTASNSAATDDSSTGLPGGIKSSNASKKSKGYVAPPPAFVNGFVHAVKSRAPKGQVGAAARRAGASCEAVSNGIAMTSQRLAGENGGSEDGGAPTKPKRVETPPPAQLLSMLNGGKPIPSPRHGTSFFA